MEKELTGQQRCMEMAGDTGFKYQKYSVLARTLMNLALYMYTGMLVVAAKITIGILRRLLKPVVRLILL